MNTIFLASKVIKLFFMLNSEHGIYPAYKCVGILIFIGRINTIIESLKARKNLRSSFFINS